MVCYTKPVANWYDKKYLQYTFEFEQSLRVNETMLTFKGWLIFKQYLHSNLQTMGQNPHINLNWQNKKRKNWSIGERIIGICMHNFYSSINLFSKLADRSFDQ